MSRIRLIFLSAVAAAGFVAATPLGVYAEGLAPQTSSEGGVSVLVTPRDLSSAAQVWEFEIVLNTHSQDLSDDLRAISELITDGRTKQAAAAWEGDPPGGHHRKGVLRFVPVTPRPNSIELRILRLGEAAPRSFEWQLK